MLRWFGASVVWCIWSAIAVERWLVMKPWDDFGRGSEAGDNWKQKFDSLIKVVPGLGVLFGHSAGKPGLAYKIIQSYYQQLFSYLQNLF